MGVITSLYISENHPSHASPFSINNIIIDFDSNDKDKLDYEHIPVGYESVDDIVTKQIKFSLNLSKNLHI
jgi:hypothetical protein